MRSVIWKLSALAAVVGMGLVGVVYQQGGFRRVTGAPTAVVAAPGAPAPKVPGQKKTPAEQQPPGEPADPFLTAGAQPEAGSESAPPQLNAGADETPEEFPTTTRTRGRTNARSRGGQSETELTEPGAPELVNSAETTVRGQQDGDPTAAPPRPGYRRQTEPDSLEGTPAGDPEPSNLVADDAFQEGRLEMTKERTLARGNPTRAPAVRSRPNMNETEDDVLTRNSRTGPNPFDQGGETQGDQPPPVVGNGRGRPRKRLIEDDPADVPSVAPAAAEQIVIPNAEDPQYGPTSQFQEQTASRSQAPQGKARPRLGDEEDAFPQGGGARAAQPRVSSERPGLEPRPRPQGFPNDDLENTGSGNAGPGDIEASAGGQPIPKLNRDASAADSEMPPAVAQGGQNRRNALLDDGDDEPRRGAPPPAIPGGAIDNLGAPPSGGSGGTEADPAMTDSAIPAPTQRRPNKHVVEVDPNNAPSGLTGPQPEAAVSRDSSTDVIAPPQRRTSGGEFPGANTANRGRPQVTIEKRAPATAYIGQPLIYHIVIRNIGNGPAQQVSVDDIVPNGVAMQGSIPQAELVGNKLSWKIGTLAAGEERKISVKVIPGAEGAVGSAAKVNFVADPAMYASTGDPEGLVPATPVGSPAATLASTGGVPLTNRGRTTPRGNASVTLDIKGPKQVGVGQPFDVRFRLTNRTNQPFTGVMIRKTLPGGLQHESGFQDLEYRVGDLGAAESRDVTLKLTAVQPGRSVSRVMVMGADGRVLHSQEFSIDAGGIGNQSNSADLPVTLQRLGDTRPRVNRPTAYANRLTNNGKQAVSGLRVTETVPKGMEFVSAGDDGQYDAATRKVVWTVENLSPSASKDLEISLITKEQKTQTTSVLAEDPAGKQGD